MVLNAAGYCLMVLDGGVGDGGVGSTVLKVLDVCGLCWASLDVLQESLMVFNVAGLHMCGTGWF